METLLVANTPTSRENTSGRATIDRSGPVTSPSPDVHVNIVGQPGEGLSNDEACESSAPATTSSTQAPQFTVNNESLLSSLPPSLPGSHITKAYMDHLRNDSFQRLSRMQAFTPMPHTVEIFTIVEIYLEETNAFLPIFHPRSLRLLCQRGAMSERPDPLWWACMNVILATTTQSRSTDGGFSKVSEFSWAFFKNAFSVYDDIMTPEPSI